MREVTQRKEFQKCIEALKLRYMKEAVAHGASHEQRHEAALKHHVLDRVVADMANYEPEKA